MILKKWASQFLEADFHVGHDFTSDVYAKKCPTLSLKNVGQISVKLSDVKTVSDTILRPTLTLKNVRQICSKTSDKNPKKCRTENHVRHKTPNTPFFTF